MKKASAWVYTHAPAGTRWGTKTLALLLSLALCLTLLPTAALAGGTDDTGGASTPAGTPLTQALLDTWLENEDPYDPNSEKVYKMQGGIYYLDEDVCLVGDNAGLFISDDVILDLNGYVLDLRGANICAFGNLTLKDSSTGDQPHKFRVEESGLWVWDETNGTKTVDGGVITGGVGATMDGGSFGGGVYVYSNLTMEGGSIVGCTASFGGGVYMMGGDSTFTMEGGHIVGCTAGKKGGGVDVDNNSGNLITTKFTMEGGSIEDCTAANGGGVYTQSNTEFTMKGGSIQNCTATESGGGVYSSNAFTMESGSISNCTADIGGGVYVGNGTFTMESGSIAGCTAARGGGVYTQESTQFTMTGGSIQNCTATQVGGGVFVNRQTDSQGRITVGTFTMDGGSISGCKMGKDKNNLVDNAIHADGTFNNNTNIDKSLLSGINAGHTGTSSTDPILIGSVEGLKDFRNRVNNGETTLCATLLCDIVLNDGTFDADGGYSEGSNHNADPWTPIGNADKRYSGTFNGNGKTIKGLYVNVINPNQSNIYHAGLFGYTDGATIQNVTVDGYVSISGDVTDEYASTSVGGIVGSANNTTITGCTNLCTVKSACSSVGSGSFAGGIAGNVNKANEGSYSVTKCRNSGKVILTASYDGLNVGGIAGSSNALVSNCYNTGNIEVTSEYTAHRWLCMGGVVGQNCALAQVSNCYNTGTVTVTGDVDNATSVGFGGVVGVSGGTVSKCYNTGKVTCDNDNANVGGVAGVNHDATVTDCYFLTGTATNGVGNTVAGGTTENVEEKAKAEFADGTVLGLLQNSEQNSPWTMTGYLEAAKMTLPLLSWQSADAHDHNYSWKYTATEHWKECSCGVIEAGSSTAHSGEDDGNCTTAVNCDTCGYEITAAQSEHNWGDWAQDSGKDTHTRKCQTEGCAGSETGACADSDADGKCDVCGKVLRSSSTGDSSSRPGYTVTVEKSSNGAVSTDRKTASRGTTVTITVTPDKGYTLETLTVLDKDGNELTLTDKGSGRYTFTMPSGSVTVTATFMDDNTMLNFFVDVKSSTYYYDAVLWAVRNGITSGTDAVHFSPNQPCTRAQIVTFLWRAAGSPVVNYAMNMSDVPENAYYAEAVRWALSEGITTGTTAATFGPNETCTRAQTVAFLFRYAAPAVVTLQELVSGFSDAASVPGYALPAMNWALAGGIVQGDGSNLLPNDSCTRAQIVTFLYRALEK